MSTALVGEIAELIEDIARHLDGARASVGEAKYMFGRLADMFDKDANGKIADRNEASAVERIEYALSHASNQINAAEETFKGTFVEDEPAS
jgi:hypothetical protein